MRSSNLLSLLLVVVGMTVAAPAPDLGLRTVAPENSFFGGISGNGAIPHSCRPFTPLVSLGSFLTRVPELTSGRLPNLINRLCQSIRNRE